MGRFVNPTTQYFDNSGNVLAGGKLYFFESNTTTPLDTFSDAALTVPNPNPVILDGGGRVGNVFLGGEYNVVLTDANDRQIWERDPVGDISTTEAFNDWSATQTYSLNDIVEGSDGNFYLSLQNSNFGNDPTSQPSAFWVEILFIRPFNVTATYREGEPTIASNGLLYISQIDSNTNNDPTIDDGTNWLPITADGSSPNFTGLNIDKTDAEETGITYSSDDDIYWDLHFNTNEDFSIDRWNGTGSLINQVVVIDTATSDINLNGDGQMIVNFNSDIGEINEIDFSDGGIRRWAILETAATDFAINLYDAAGNFVTTPFRIDEGTSGDVALTGNLSFSGGTLTSNNATGMDILATNNLDTSIRIDFENVASLASVTVFSNTTAPNATFNIADGSGSPVNTIVLDGVDGSIQTAADEGGVKIRRHTISTLSPSGGQDGDFWMQYT